MLRQGVTDIDWRDVVLETKIGAGAFGNVYKGTVWPNQDGRDGCKIYIDARQPAARGLRAFTVIAASCAADICEMHSSLCSCKKWMSEGCHHLRLLAATWKGRAVAVKVMLASHGEHAGELESFRQEVRLC